MIELRLKFSTEPNLKIVLGAFTEPEWEFMKKLEDVEAAEREKAFFECDVSDPEAEVTWLRDGKVR